MPKDPTVSRYRTPVQSRRKGRDRRSASGVRSTPLQLDTIPLHKTQGDKIRRPYIRRQSPPAPKKSLQDKTDKQFYRVHANCVTILKTAEEAQQKLKAQIEDQTREALSAQDGFDAEKQRLTSWVRKLRFEQQRAAEEMEKAVKENRELRQSGQYLQERLDALNAANKDHVTRLQLNKILGDIRDTSSNTTKVIDQKLLESPKILPGHFHASFCRASRLLALLNGAAGMNNNLDGSQLTPPLLNPSNPQSLPEISPYIPMG